MSNNNGYDKYDNKYGGNYRNRFYNDYNSYNYNRGNNRFRRFIEIDLGENNNEIDEKIKKELENLGYHVVEVKGDGNCLFRSISEQIEGDENNYKHYRELSVDYILQNKDDFAPFLDEDEPFDKYIEKMSKDAEWAGNLEIYALSMALEANFCIYLYNQPCYVIKNWETPKYNIFLSYHNGKHYNSFRKLNKEKEEKKENETKEEKEEKEKIHTETFDKNAENKSKVEEMKENKEENPREEVIEKPKEEKKENLIENNEINKEEKPKDDIDEFLSKVNHLNI